MLRKITRIDKRAETQTEPDCIVRMELLDQNVAEAFVSRYFEKSLWRKGF